MSGDVVSPFVIGGAVPLDAQTYVSRAHDDEGFAHLTAGRWVLLLGPRQHGKSSTLIRLRPRLLESGYACALIDIQAYAATEASYIAFLRWFAVRVARAIGTELAEPAVSDLDDLE